MVRKVTLAEKYEAIVAYETGKQTMGAVAKRYGVTRTAFGYWLKHRERIRTEMVVRATFEEKRGQAEEPAEVSGHTPGEGADMPSIEYYKKKNKDLEKEVEFLKVRLAYSNALNSVLKKRLPPEEGKKKAALRGRQHRQPSMRHGENQGAVRDCGNLQEPILRIREPGRPQAA